MKILSKSFFLAILLIAGCDGDGKGKDSGLDEDMDADSDMDADADGDADADADADADVDCDPDGECGYGENECVTNTDCALISCGCECPGLWLDETTSYCYESCDLQNSCDAGQECVIEEEGSNNGVCLRTGYLEMSWQGQYIPADVEVSFEYLTPVEYNLEVGNLSEKFEWMVIQEKNHFSLGKFVEIISIGRSSSYMIQLHIIIPADRWKDNTTIYFSKCDDLDYHCSAILIHAYVTAPQTKAHVQAINVTGNIDESKESWIHIENAPKNKGQFGKGTCKIFLAEYFAEIAPDSPMPKLPQTVYDKEFRLAQASTSIATTSGQSYTIKSGATVYFDAPIITLKKGFKAESGSHFYAPAVPEE